MRSYDVEDTGQRLVSILDLRSLLNHPKDATTSNFADASFRSKAGICDGVPSTAP